MKYMGNIYHLVMYRPDSSNGLYRHMLYAVRLSPDRGQGLIWRSRTWKKLMIGWISNSDTVNFSFGILRFLQKRSQVNKINHFKNPIKVSSASCKVENTVA